MFKGDNMLYYCSNCGEKIDDENQKFCIQCGRQLKLNDYQKKLKFINAEKEHLGEHYEMEILSLMEYTLMELRVVVVIPLELHHGLQLAS